MKHLNLTSSRIIIPLILILVTLSVLGLAHPVLTAQAAPPAQEGTAEPTAEPTSEPTSEPTAEPTSEPTAEPTSEPTAEPTAEPTSEPSGLTLEVTGPTNVTVGDTFEVSVVAKNIPDPGIFGYQFWLNWDDAVLSPVSGTLVLSTDFPLQAQREVSVNQLKLAASREGDVGDLTGPLTLLTWTFQANSLTEPDATTLSLAEWKVGRKGGLDVPVAQVINLDVVVEEVEVPGVGDIVGNVTGQGRAADNQADHDVTAVGDLGGILTDLTDANGDFWITDAPADIYDVTASRAGFLAATCQDVVHTAEALTSLANVIMLAGDIDSSGNIDITDAVAIGTVFGSTTPGEVADLNADGEVDVLDLILMAANFGQTSAANPWVCL
jgi:hypothetical protein